MAAWLDAARAAGPPLGLVLAVQASIYFGIATPTEGGAIGVVGAVLLGLVKGKLGLEGMRQSLDSTGILCSSVIFLLLGASFFTLVFRGLDGQVMVEALFRGIPAGELGFLIFLNAAVFLLAFFLDFFEIAVIVLPLVAPIAHKMGIDMTWLTVLLAVNLQTSFMHPPFGIALYNLRSVAPASVTTSQIYWGALPFLAIQIAFVGILIAWPQLASAPAASCRYRPSTLRRFSSQFQSWNRPVAATSTIRRPKNHFEIERAACRLLDEVAEGGAESSCSISQFFAAWPFVHSPRRVLR